MRVIGGKARGYKLKKVPGDSTRPVTDRVKENLFNILGDWVIGTTWLDLFAGTGQVGIEALSRGASSVVFVDNNRTAIKTIEANISHTKLVQGAIIRYVDAFAFLRDTSYKPFDVIYVAPPQYRELWLKALSELDRRPGRFLADEGIVIIQIDPREFQEVNLDYLTLSDQRRYGSTLLCFYEFPVAKVT